MGSSQSQSQLSITYLRSSQRHLFVSRHGVGYSYQPLTGHSSFIFSSSTLITVDIPLHIFNSCKKTSGYKLIKDEMLIFWRSVSVWSAIQWSIHWLRSRCGRGMRPIATFHNSLFDHLIPPSYLRGVRTTRRTSVHRLAVYVPWGISAALVFACLYDF